MFAVPWCKSTQIFLYVPHMQQLLVKTMPQFTTEVLKCADLLTPTMQSKI